ncbi:MAG: RAD55 family ATPase [Candidatus Helarchaeota archaeon]
MEVKRIKTGIPELDPLIGDGFQIPSLILVLGPPGSGKTTFSLQYLFEGAKHREKGILFSTLSESPASMIQFASNYWFIDSKLIGKRIFIIDLSEKMKVFETGDEFLNEIDDKVRKFNIKRIVIDPINLIQLSIPEIKEYRMFIFEFSKYIKENNLQAVVTAELYSPKDYHCHEAYISDGTFLLQNIEKNGRELRYLTIVKMRGVHHQLKPIEYVITKYGIQLKV